MAISSIGSQLRYLQAVKVQNTPVRRHPERSEGSPTVEKDSSIKLKSPLNMTDYKNIQVLKNFAQSNNITDIDDEDIQYALKYGTSLFADYSA